jgi:hypothetical protein
MGEPAATKEKCLSEKRECTNASGDTTRSSLKSGRILPTVQ